jgi:hypothetical protein
MHRRRIFGRRDLFSFELSAGNRTGCRNQNAGGSNGLPIWMAVWLANAADKVVFVISVVLALLAVIVWVGIARIPVVQAHLFGTLLIAYLLLLAGNLVRGM